MGKRENLYAKEFINYYIKLGVDKIFIYDDNDLNEESFMDVFNKLGEYKNFIEIYKNASTIKHQSNAFTDCYNKNKDNFDWFLMIDMDEFLVIVNDKLKNYLLQSVFKKCDFINKLKLIGLFHQIITYYITIIVLFLKGSKAHMQNQYLSNQ